MAQSVFGGDDTVGGGGVGEEAAAVGVADAEIIFGRGLHAIVDADEATVGGQADGFQADVGGVGAAAGGDENTVGLEFFTVGEGDGDRCAVDGDGFDFCADVDLDAALGENFGSRGGDLGVDAGQNLREHF